MNRFSYEFIQIIIWYWIGNGNVQTQRVKRKFRERESDTIRNTARTFGCFYSPRFYWFCEMHAFYYGYSVMFPLLVKRISKIEFFEKPTPWYVFVSSVFFSPIPFLPFLSFFVFFFFGFLYFAWLVLQEQRLFPAHRQETFLINREMYSPRDRE